MGSGGSRLGLCLDVEKGAHRCVDGEFSSRWIDMRLPLSSLLSFSGPSREDMGNSMGLILEARSPSFLFSLQVCFLGHLFLEHPCVVMMLWRQRAETVRLSGHTGQISF